ncbi:MAG: helix-turn-helix transcriptional regulator [Lentisphaeria bacterium]|nr:helix-turn-helix transcriptional regulator [Lentisphaeria bacterium]
MKIEKLEDLCDLFDRVSQIGYTISFDSKPAKGDPPSFYDYHIHRFWEVKIFSPVSPTSKYKIMIIAPGTVHCLTQREISMDISPHAITIFVAGHDNVWQMFFEEGGDFSCNLIPELLFAVTKYSKEPEFEQLRFQLLNTALDNLKVLIRQHIAVPKVAKHGKNIVKKAIDYMENSYYNPELSIIEIASFIGISPQYLNSVLQKETGKSTRQNLINIRLKHACELLKSGEYLVKDVAILTGWKSAYYFSNVFRSSFGISPKKYQD